MRKRVWQYRWVLSTLVVAYMTLTAAPAIINAARAPQGQRAKVAATAAPTPTRLIDKAPAGTVVASIHFNDGHFAAMLAPGDRVEILASSGTTKDGKVVAAQRLVPKALVLQAPTDPASKSPVLVAVSPEDASLISGAAAWATLSGILLT